MKKYTLKKTGLVKAFLSIRMPLRLIEKIEDEAFRNGMSRNEFLIRKLSK